MNFRLDKELKISKLKKIIKLLNKTQNKVVKISVNGKLYDFSKIIENDDYAVFEPGDFKLIIKAGEWMIVEFDEELRLSKFRKIISIIKSKKIIKVKINGKYYDISKITDKKDMTIFEVDGVEESEVIKTDSVDKNDSAMYPDE